MRRCTMHAVRFAAAQGPSTSELNPNPHSRQPQASHPAGPLPLSPAARLATLHPWGPAEAQVIGAVDSLQYATVCAS
jgi:hypothetical protein